MNVKFLGQACTLIETKNKRILCDPWIIGPCNVNSWYHLSSKITSKKDIPYDVDYIYISHEHTDHFHIETLKNFNRNIPVLICKFPTDRFYNQVVNQGFKDIRILDSWKKEKIEKDIEVTIIKNSELMLEDSAMLIKSNEGTIFCQTDCGMSFESLQKVAKEKPDIGFFKYGAANWYPIVYNYDKEKLIEISKKRKKSKLVGFVNYVKAVKPKFVVPYAGPPIFLHQTQTELNDPINGMFATPDEVEEIWKEQGDEQTKLKVLFPGDEINVKGEVNDQNTGHVNKFNKMEIIKELSKEIKNDLKTRYDEEGKASKNLKIKIKDYFNKIISENEIARKHINIKVQFIAEGNNGGDFVLDFTKENTENFVSEEKINDWNYFMKIPEHLVDKAISDKLLWETLFLSCRWKADRKPDQWNEHLMNLFYDPDPKRIRNIYKIYDKLYK